MNLQLQQSFVNLYNYYINDKKKGIRHVLIGTGYIPIIDDTTFMFVTCNTLLTI